MEGLSLDIENQIDEVFKLQQNSVVRMRNSSAKYRIQQLKRLKQYILDHEKDILEAMYKDFKKPASEVLLAEIFGIKHEIDQIINSLSDWMKPKSVSNPLFLTGISSFIQYESKGLSLILSPWNYPLNLCINPLALSIAAGNTVILKPSELTPNVSRFIKQMINHLFDKSEVYVFEGESHVASALLKLKFDHIFFTGSPAIGKKVMEAASRHLTSVTLELGGKSPAIVHESVDLSVTAKKIIWGKFFNNGQTCIAPDYLFVHSSIFESFLEALKTEIIHMYGETIADYSKSNSYARIVNERHFQRLMHLLEDAIDKGAKTFFGGENNPSDNLLMPTLLINVTEDMQVMIDEIFGPILPIKLFQHAEELVEYFKDKDKPLAFYIFSKDKEFDHFLLQNTSSGTAVINDSLIQFGHPNLPFGGVNHSGIGKTSGYFGYLEFSNQKSVIRQRTNLMQMIYPPYTIKVRWMIEKMVKWL